MGILTTILSALASLMMGFAAFSKHTSKIDQGLNFNNKSDSFIGKLNTLELIRAEFKTAMRVYKTDSVGLRNELRKALNGEIAESWALMLTNWHSFGEGGLSVKVDSVSALTDAIQYVDVSVKYESTRQLASMVSPEVSVSKYRLNLGYQSVFSNAVTGNQMACIFCHVRIFGDVAEYGVSADGSTGMSRGNNDRIHGAWYIAGEQNTDYLRSNDGTVLEVGTTGNPTELPLYSQNVTPDLVSINPYSCPGEQPALNCSGSPWAINDLRWYTAVREVKKNYHGPKLPWNPQRQLHMLPKVELAPLIFAANGYVKSENPSSGITLVKWGGTYTSDKRNVVQTERIEESNVILKGTQQYPLIISGRVYFRGDVIISGYIKGKGAIYSGRNVYVAGDIKYVNPPPQLKEESEENNKAMTLISYCAKKTGESCTCGSADCFSKASLMSEEWKKNATPYDQLFLFASNNIVTSDPFTSSAEVAPGKPLNTWNNIYAERAGLDDYNGKLAIDPRTGYMLDPVEGQNGQFVVPWEKKGSAVYDTSLTEATETSTRKMARKEVVQEYSNPSKAPDDKAWYMQMRHLSPSTAYQNIFYPKNAVKNGGVWELKDWITKNQFRDEARDSMVAEVVDSKGQYPFFKRITLPLFAESPWNPNNWQGGNTAAGNGKTEGAVYTIERVTGLMTKMQNNRVYPSNTASSSYFRDVVELFFNRIKGSLITSPDGATINGAARTRFSGGISHPIKLNGSNFGQDISALEAFLFYDPNYCWSSPSRVCDCTNAANRCGKASMKLKYYSADWSKGAVICGDVLPMGYVGEVKYGASNATCVGGMTADADLRDVSDDPISIYFRYNFNEIEMRTTINTRYWNPAMAEPRVKVKRIDAFLFANQFVFFASDRVTGNDMKINGGIIAKDIFGGTMNGPAPTDSFGSFFQGKKHNFAPANAYSFTSGYYGANTVGLTVVLDPRAQFDMDLIYSDFGKVVSSGL